MLARLDDRQKARLGLTLGPALTVLVESDKLPADLAVVIFGLAEPIEAWTWHSSDFAKTILERLPPGRREWFFWRVLVEVDRSDQLSPARASISALSALAAAHLPRSHLHVLASKRSPGDAIPSRRYLRCGGRTQSH
jgi:hypothetical protein